MPLQANGIKYLTSKSRITRFWVNGRTWIDFPIHTLFHAFMRKKGLILMGICSFGLIVSLSAEEAKKVFEVPDGFARMGSLMPRHALEIEGNNWSVGAETMDRDYTIYPYWREHLGPLGVKRARLQSGWAKTEKHPGEYDWRWLDEIIPDMVTQGVKPWVCLSYGNLIYEGGGDPSSSSPLPSTPEALGAWDNFVRAFVQRYKAHVDEWEIWNEPRHKGISIEDYADFVIRTGEIIRSEQPSGKIFVLSSAGIRPDDAVALLKILKAEGKLGLVDKVTYHPYNFNPTGARSAGLRQAVREYSDKIDIFQGECGIPSTPESYGALAHPDNSELRQAKWSLRRLLGDLGHDIPSSYFSIADMHYITGGKLNLNSKGLIATKPDKSFDYLKPAYRAVQHVTAVFDNSLKRIPDSRLHLEDSREDLGAIEAHVYAKIQNRGNGSRADVVTLWRNGVPDNSFRTGNADVTVYGGQFMDPVYVDLLSGQVYDFPDEGIERTGQEVTFKAVPIGDWPVLIADRASLPCRIIP